MKNLFLLDLAIVFFSCGPALRIKIHNKTGFDVDSAGVGDKNIGSIKKDQTIIIDDCNEIEMQDNVVFGSAKGIINGEKQINEDDSLSCAMGLETIKKGEFEFDLVLIKKNDGYNLRFDKTKDVK